MIETVKNISTQHAFSTRLGGVSDGDFISLNLGLQYGDIPAHVIQNWEKLSTKSGIDVSLLAATTQVHKADVAIVEKKDCLAPELYTQIKPSSDSPQPIDKDHHIYKFYPLCDCDGLVTSARGVSLAIFTADCTPLLLNDPEAHVSAALHCGWKSFTGDIINNGLYAMDMLGADRNRIQAAIGPCIGKCCFEVGDEVAQAFRKLLGSDAEKCIEFTNSVEHKYHADLRGGVEARLTQLGVPLSNISHIDECTCCNSDKYFSYRKENAHTGRLASVISNK